jgi:hypothetical protein
LRDTPWVLNATKPDGRLRSRSLAYCAAATLMRRLSVFMIAFRDLYAAELTCFPNLQLQRRIQPLVVLESPEIRLPGTMMRPRPLLD